MPAGTHPVPRARTQQALPSAPPLLFTACDVPVTRLPTTFVSQPGTETRYPACTPPLPPGHAGCSVPTGTAATAHAPTELIARKRLFSRLVEMIAEDFGLKAHYAGACARGIAQFWRSDRGVRIEPDVLRRASVSTLQVLAAHELGHAWSAHRRQAVPLHGLGLALGGAGVALSGSWVAGALFGLLATGVFVNLAHEHASSDALIEEIRADWFALNAGCTARQLEAAFDEAAQMVDRPLSTSLHVRVHAARRLQTCRSARGALLLVRGWLLWLPRPARQAGSTR